MGRVFLYFFNSAWSASFLILAVLVLRLVLRKMPKQLFVPLWGIAALRLLISFGPSFRFSLTPSRAPLRLSPVGIPLAETGFETVDSALQPLLADSFDCVPTVFFISYRTESGTAYQNEGLTYFDGVLTVPPDCRAVRLHALWQLPTYENSADYYFFIR